MENRAEKISNLFNTITAWGIFEIVFGVILAWVIVKVTARVLPLLAERLPVSLRQGTLNAIPIVRVLVIVLLILWATGCRLVIITAR